MADEPKRGSSAWCRMMAGDMQRQANAAAAQAEGLRTKAATFSGGAQAFLAAAEAVAETEAATEEVVVVVDPETPRPRDQRAAEDNFFAERLAARKPKKKAAAKKASPAPTVPVPETAAEEAGDGASG